VAQLPEVQRLFDETLLDDDACVAILEQARELLLIRNLQNIQQVGALQRMTEHFEARTAELENKHRRDALTGVFNRGHLDHVLDAEFRSAVAGGWPLSIVFADLDRFKQVNDTYGHRRRRGADCDGKHHSRCGARYGLRGSLWRRGFIIILPGLGSDGAKKIGERLLARLRSAHHEVAAYGDRDRFAGSRHPSFRNSV